jgi:hypothetical protein
VTSMIESGGGTPAKNFLIVVAAVPSVIDVR